jgi:polar amino acid transport system permease protein
MWYFFTQFVPDHLVYLLEGAVVTLELCFVSMAVGIAIGVVSAILAIAGGGVMKGFVRIYVSICRGVPLIVILLFIYFTLPDPGLRLPAFWAGVLGSASISALISAKSSGPRSWRSIRARPKPASPLASAASRSIARSYAPGGYHRRAHGRRLFHLAAQDCASSPSSRWTSCCAIGTYIISATFRSMETYMLVGAIYYVMSVVAAHHPQSRDAAAPAYLRV